MKELWKDVIGYEGLYQISDLGRVKSLKRRFVITDRILKNKIGSDGYEQVGLSKNGVAKTICIHKLVAIAFLSHTPCGMKLVVDHIDNNPLNNKLSNLQIISNRENTRKDSKSKGAYWHKGMKSWVSSIYMNGKLKHLGYFSTRQEALDKHKECFNTLSKGELYFNYR